MGFCSLQHIKDRRSTCRGLCLPATFRLQGLATLVTAYSLRSRAGSVSHRLRSWDSPFGASSSRKVSARFRTEEPTYRCSCRYTLRHAQGRLDRPRFLGFSPLGNPWQPPTRLARRPLAAPLGFCPSRVPNECLGRDFALPPPTRFPDRLTPARGAPEYRSASVTPRPRSCGTPQTKAKAPS